MSSQKQPASLHSGIHLNRLNIMLIAFALVIALLMILSMYQTTGSFQRIVSVTEAYLSAQQTAGMLKNISDTMAEQCTDFLLTGSPDPVYTYAGQLNAINTQLASDAAYKQSGDTVDEFMEKALDSFNALTEAEIRAMRLMAETLPMGLEAFPPLLQQAELSPEDRALSTEEKKATALALVDSEAYRSWSAELERAVDDSHRIASEKGKNQALQTAQEISRIIRHQKIMVFLLVIIAFIALLFNRFLIIRPIQRSVDNLDRREPIPVRGSYEVRHLASVYNDVLKDNVEKAAALSYAATHDALTGIYNRAAFDRVYGQYMNSHSGLMVADVDHFKQFNDEHGHDIGDKVLQIVAEKLKEHFRAGDFVCRIGGDEFCIIMPDTGHAQADSMVDKIRAINRDLSDGQDHLPPISISAGFAFWDRPDPRRDLFKDADQALLDIKKTRADCCAVWPG